MSSGRRSPGAKTVFDMRISGTRKASVAFAWPVGGAPAADLVGGRALEKPRAAGISGFHFESAVQLRRVADDLVAEERIEVRIGYTHDRIGGGWTRRGGTEGESLPGQFTRKGRQVGRVDRIFRHPVKEHLESPLVTDRVPVFLNDSVLFRHHGHAPLGQRRGLVDEGPLGARKELPVKPGETGHLVVPDGAVELGEPPGDPGGVPDDPRKGAPPRIHLELGGDSLLSDIDGGEGSVREALAQAGYLPFQCGLLRRVRYSACGGMAESFTHDLRKFSEFPCPELPAVVAGGNSLAAGHDPHTAAHRGVPAALLRLPVLGRRVPALSHGET